VSMIQFAMNMFTAVHVVVCPLAKNAIVAKRCCNGNAIQTVVGKPADPSDAAYNCMKGKLAIKTCQDFQKPGGSHRRLSMSKSQLGEAHAALLRWGSKGSKKSGGSKKSKKSKSATRRRRMMTMSTKAVAKAAAKATKVARKAKGAVVKAASKAKKVAVKAASKVKTAVVKAANKAAAGGTGYLIKKVVDMLTKPLPRAYKKIMADSLMLAVKMVQKTVKSGNPGAALKSLVYNKENILTFNSIWMSFWRYLWVNGFLIKGVNPCSLDCALCVEFLDNIFDAGMATTIKIGTPWECADPMAVKASCASKPEGELCALCKKKPFAKETGKEKNTGKQQRKRGQHFHNLYNKFAPFVSPVKGAKDSYGNLKKGFATEHRATLVFERFLLWDKSVSFKNPHGKDCTRNFKHSEYKKGGNPICKGELNVFLAVCQTCCCKRGKQYYEVSASLEKGGEGPARRMMCAGWFAFIDGMARATVQVLVILLGVVPNANCP